MRVSWRRIHSTSSSGPDPRDLLPPDGDLNGLVTSIASARQRPIIVTRRPLPSGISGLWDERFPDHDFVIIDDVPMAPSRYAAVLCHELAHIVLGHHGVLDASSGPPLTDAIDASIAQRFLKRCAYNDPMERDAEELATVLTREHLLRAHYSALQLNRVSSRLR